MLFISEIKKQSWYSTGFFSYIKFAQYLIVLRSDNGPGLVQPKLVQLHAVEWTVRDFRGHYGHCDFGLCGSEGGNVWGTHSLLRIPHHV